MSATLARSVVRAATDRDSVVLDPMAGSGTVLAAARALGRSCYAFDLDPLAILMLRVIASHYDVRRTELAGEQVQREAKALSADKGRVDRLMDGCFDDETRSFVDFWFPKKSARGLFALWQSICRVKPTKVRDVLALAFSRVIIAKTAGVSRAIDLPHTRPHRKTGKAIPDPLAMFPRRLGELLKALPNTADKHARKPLLVRNADARRLPLADSSVDLVLTSSPYANAIDYMRAHKFSLVWMGHSLSELRALRARLVGAEQSERLVRGDLPWLEGYLASLDGKYLRRQGILRKYFYDMDRILAELHRVLKPGGACVLVLGRSTVGDHVIDTPSIIARLAQQRGFRHVRTRFRVINPLRRSLPFPSSHKSSSPLGKRISQEAIVGLER